MVARLAARVLAAPLSRRDSFGEADAVVVLGCPLRQDGSLSEALEERVRVGVELWRRGAAPLLCVTGGGPPDRVEAVAMAARARALGVSEVALRVEAESVNTGENARFVARLLAADGCRTVWIVSQPFHLLRATLLFRKFGFRALAWHAEDSLQHRAPRLALTWLVREYAALARFALLEVGPVLRGDWRADRRRAHLRRD